MQKDRKKHSRGEKKVARTANEITSVYNTQVLAYAKRIHPKYISFLAMLADCGGVIDESRFCSRYFSTQEPNFDIFLPNNPAAVKSAMSNLSFAKIKWNNILLEDITKYGTAIVPNEMIEDLIREIGPSLETLKKYLKLHLSGDGTPKDFRRAFYDLYSNWSATDQQIWREMNAHKIWVYKYKSFQKENIPDVLKTLIKKEECRGDDPETRELIGQIKKAWKKEGYPDVMLQRYINYTLVRNGIDHGSVQNLISLLRSSKSPEADYRRFRIQGTLENGTKLQLISTEGMPDTKLCDGLKNIVLQEKSGNSEGKFRNESDAFELSEWKKVGESRLSKDNRPLTVSNWVLGELKGSESVISVEHSDNKDYIALDLWFIGAYRLAYHQ
jgi:hypothetical protein